LKSKCLAIKRYHFQLCPNKSQYFCSRKSNKQSCHVCPGYLQVMLFQRGKQLPEIITKQSINTITHWKNLRKSKATQNGGRKRKTSKANGTHAAKEKQNPNLQVLHLKLFLRRAATVPTAAQISLPGTVVEHFKNASTASRIHFVALSSAVLVPQPLSGSIPARPGEGGPGTAAHFRHSSSPGTATTHGTSRRADPPARNTERTSMRPKQAQGSLLSQIRNLHLNSGTF